MSNRPLILRALSGVVSSIVGVFVVLDMTVGPVFRPLARILSESGPIAMVRSLSRRLPSYVALLFLAIPLAVAEPAKIYALYLIGDEHYISGVLTLIGAYLVSLVLVDTIYEGARPQLRSIGWFAVVVDRITAVRLATLTIVRASRAYQAAHRTVGRIRSWLGRRIARAASR